jgi:CheY-like chemotaxis protein
LPVRILLVEDCDDDAELLSIELRSAGMAFELLRVDELARLRSALLEFAPHIVVSDANLPGFSGMDALHLARELAPGLPFVFCTGCLEEDEATRDAALAAEGVVLKHQLSRLPPLIRQVLARGLRQPDVA